MTDGFDIPIETDDAEKALASLLKRLDQFGSKADKVLDEFAKDTEKATKKSQGSFDAMDKKLGSITSTLQGFGVLAIGALGIGAIDKLTGSFEGAIKAAEGKELALKGVENALKRTGQFSQDAVKDVSAFADELENTTGLADDTALKMFTLATSFTSSKEQAKKLVTAANDLSVATGKSLESAVTALGKSLTGTLGPLDEFDPSLKNMSKAALAAGGAIDSVTKNFGGAAAAQMQTFSGAVTSVENAMDDFSTTLGKLVTDNPVVIEMVKGIGQAIGSLDSSLQGSSGNIKNFIADFAIGFAKQIPPLLIAVDALTKGFENLIGDGNGITDVFNNITIVALALADEILLLARGFTELKLLASAPIDFFAAGSEDELKKMRPELAGIVNSLKEIDKRRDDLANSAGAAMGVVGAVGAPSAAASAAANTGDSALLKLAASIESSVGSMEKAATDMKDGVKKVGDQGNKPRPVVLAGGNGLPDTVDPERNLIAALGRILPDALSTLGSGLLAGLQTGGQAGAGKAVGALGSGIAQLAGAAGPVAGAIGSAIEILGQDPEAFKTMIQGFVDGIPVIIDNIVQNIPVLVETLANNLGPIITSIIAGIPRIMLALIKAIPVVIQSILSQLAGGLNFQGAKLQEFSSNFSVNINKGIDSFISKLTSGGERFKNIFSNLVTNQINFQKNLAEKQIDFARKIGDFIKGQIQKNIDFNKRIVEAGRDFALRIFEVFKRIKESFDNLIKRITDSFNIGGGGGGGVTGLGFSKGGIVPNRTLYAAGGAFVPRGTDTVPAMLTPGELVVPRDIVQQLDQNAGSDNIGIAIAMMAQVIELLSQPVQVTTVVKLRDKAFADIMLDLSRRGARTAA